MLKDTDIAIIGIAGEFPGSKDARDLWQHLLNGEEMLTPAESSGAANENDENHVPVKGDFEGMDCFDAKFFGYLPGEAQLMDPQQRKLLECSWAALEDAGYDPSQLQQVTSVFAGVGRNAYFSENIVSHPDLLEATSDMPGMLGVEKDYAATRIAHKLDLKGPAINVQTACSTSGTAVHLACQSLICGESELALAGGARIVLPLGEGYDYFEDGPLSSDGHCRPFDANASGMVRSSGAAVLVLKRAVDAVEDRDHIYAVIKSTALNNDGADKAGFTAPSVNGQARVVRDALELADIDASQVRYIEAHGTGTPVGDPIELAGLTQAFRETTDKSGFCGIGSVKSNIGHLDAAAGLAGIIKSAFALEQNTVPPTINFSAPNPQLRIEQSPFFVCSEALALDELREPYFGVSSFGLGGTNFHAVLGKAPVQEASADQRAVHLLKVSSRTAGGLGNTMRRLADSLESNAHAMTDIALTLDQGRKAFDQRGAIACRSAEDAVEKLRQRADQLSAAANSPLPAGDAQLVFMYPGGGAQYFRMARDIYASEKAFATLLDQGLAVLEQKAGRDFRSLWLESEDLETLNLPSVQLPLIFLVEYALTKLLKEWGLTPDAVIGHSMGEMTAACVAGVMPFEDTLKLIHFRGKILEQAEDGTMLSVTLAENELREILPDTLDLAVINAPEMCVVSGHCDNIDAFAKTLEDRDIDHQQVRISTAAHSRLLDDSLEEFEQQLRQVAFGSPALPLISNISGGFHDAESTRSAEYWRDQLRSTVQFSRGIETLADNGAAYFLEVGPGNNLGSLAKMTLAERDSAHACASTLRHPGNEIDDNEYLLQALGELWCEGLDLPMLDYYGTPQWHKVALPTYSFERERHWIEKSSAAGLNVAQAAQANSQSPVQQTGNVAAFPVERARKPHNVLSATAAVIEELTGVAAADIDPQASFVDLGLDSLLLSQLGLKLKKAVHVRFSLRELMGDYGNLEALAAKIEASGDKEAIAAFTQSGDDAEMAAPDSGSTEAYAEPPAAVFSSPEDYVSEKLQSIFLEVAGLDVGDFPQSGGFVDAGFDSLLLSQVGVKLKKEFGLRVSLKTLLNEANRPELLAGHILSALPDGYFDDLRASTPAPATATSRPSGAAAAAPAAAPKLSDGELTLQLEQLSQSGNPSVRIIANQVKLLNDQLSLLKKLRDAEFEAAMSRSISRYPSTSGQREIWATCQFSNDVNCSYNLSTGIRLDGAVDVAVLNEAFRTMLDRHDSLRSRFSNDGTEVIVEPVGDAHIEHSKVTGDPEESIERERARETSTAFQLNRAPLVRARLFEIDPQRFYLLITVHHIVADGISLGIILRELAQIYSASIEGRDHGLGETLPTAQAIQQLEDHEEDQRYWHRELQDRPNATELPCDFPRPNIKQYKASVIRHALATDLYESMQQYSRQNGITLFSLLLSSFQVYLGKLCPKQEIIVGVPVNNIDRSEYNHVGYYLSVVPIRANIAAETEFGEYVGTASDHIFECLEHTRCTFGEIIEELGFKRDLSRNTLVSVLFNLDSEGKAPDFAGTETTILPVPKAYENFDLFLSAIPGPNGLQLQCTYNTSLFLQDTIERWMDGYEAMLAQGLREASQPLALLPSSSETELQKLAIWNDTTLESPADYNLIELIAAHAQSTGSKTCAESPSGNLDYATLESASTRLAQRLVESGVSSGDLVGACFDRRPDMLIGLLAIWKAGAAYVPLDPGYPTNRLEYMLEQSRSTHILAHREHLDIVPDYQCTRVCLDEQLGDHSPSSTALPGPADIAYVIFTSGSTGNPKGVQVPHSCVLNFLQSMAREPGFSASDRLLAVTTLSFDIAVLELWLPLLQGGTTVIADGSSSSDGKTIVQLIEQFSITIMQATPGTWRLLLEAGWQGSSDFVALCGGEPMPANLASELVPRTAALWNMYGPTETTVWSTIYRVQDPEGPLFVGRPIANTRCHILDERMQPCPLGAAGELFIGGAGVTAGYLDREELTRERFVADPFSDDPEAKLYRTGDLARWHSGGQIEFYGRLDNQVKLRGFRIELGEIESALARMEGISECAVIVREDQPGDQRLTAYFTTGSGQEPERQTLRSTLAETLPHYMIPQGFVAMDELPRTPNGKIDRKSLPLPQDAAVAQQPQQHEELSSDAERYLASLWSELLSDPGPFYPEDNFFDIGGHSLLAAQLCAKIYEQRSVDVPVFEVITATLGQLAEKYLETGEQVADASIAARPEPEPKGWLDSLRRKIGLGRVQ